MRKRYVAHIAALNLGLVMRTAFGYGTPRQAAAVALAILLAALRNVTRVLMHLLEIIFGMLLPHDKARPVRPAWAA